MPEQEHDEQEEKYDEETLVLRALISSKEAGILIGKGGQSVGPLRQQFNVKVGVSKVTQGVNERIVIVSGLLEDVAKAYGAIYKIISDGILETERTIIRILISHQLIGSVIGKGGATIKNIQEVSGSKIVISKDMLPQSTERVVEILGGNQAIEEAILLLGEIILEEADNATGTILYDTRHAQRSNQFSYTSTLHRPNTRSDQPSRPKRVANNRTSQEFKRREGNRSTDDDSKADEKTQILPVPVDLVGCIIGSRGHFIDKVRKVSGCKIHVTVQQKDKSDRNVEITGTTENISKALEMIQTQLETEKSKKSNELDISKLSVDT
ncbi:hypothetical protein BC833DRAFT_593254 [Globomyces pollinis-pini]|nr:hypothetical protein BC833DRAFT_593254 [Globomyces pollinis-pini]